MWLALAFASACLLGFYDVAKKRSLKDNAVQTLTDSTLIPMGPTCTADGSVCAFYNGDGALYTIRLK